MPADRLIVRFAYQRGWQVVDGSTILQTSEKKEEAFQFLVDRGARVWLQWSRTVIGGKAPPYDFAASFMQDAVGRILKTIHGKEAGTWFWTCYEGGANGKVPTKDEAVVGVERAYTRRVVKADWRAM
ncbi:MAG: hypothetical protein E5X67_36230 [Mesorhizobium sp.]|uniref:hypothetical protein n=1 Tax=Mesorhizobium sp. TaxID=1871066 RepID=UPI0011F9D1FD|nr:hypothetical protein [Mesorhizobium sp.]TIP22711.1 MAG: hypothetical protein E5X67_36230 [Mesorhizobium sp.]